MKNYETESQSGSTFLVYTLGQDEIPDAMSLSMLSNNKIKGIAPTSFLQLDSEQKLKFDVSSRRPLSELMAGSLKKEQILSVFSGIAHAIDSCNVYMIDPAMLQLGSDMIYVNPSSFDTIAVCNPISPKDSPQPLSSRLKSILVDINPDPSENNGYIQQLLKCFSSPDVTASSVLGTLNDISAGEAKAVPGSAMAPMPPTVPVPDKLFGADPVPVPGTLRNEVPRYQEKDISGVNNAPGQQVQPQGEEISLFYLLQHYNKDNAAAYKAQKDAKKAASEKPGKKNREKKNRREEKNTEQGGFGFAVPGMENIPLSKPAEPSVIPVYQQEQPAPAYHAGQPAVPQADPGRMAWPESTPDPLINSAGSSAKAAYSAQTGLQDLYSMQDRPAETAVSQTPPQSAAAQHEAVCFLIRRKTGERVNVSENGTRIGRDPKLNDFVISDNNLVGRKPHAIVILKDGECWVVDNNSTNHTFINGTEIKAFVQEKLKDGSILTLADEEFTVYIR